MDQQQSSSLYSSESSSDLAIGKKRFVEEIAASDAYASLGKNKYWVWPQRGGEENRVEPITLPKFSVPFKMASGINIFTIGSCFARNVEQKLSELGFYIPSLEIGSYGAASASVLNNYATPSILNEMRWALDDDFNYDPDVHLYKVGNKYVDLHLASRWATPVTRDVAIERRNQIREIYSQIKNSRVIVITLGLIEVWYDSELELYLNSAPMKSLVKNNPDRFSLRVLRHQEAYQYLANTFQLIKDKCRDDVQCILTVSPVPLQSTFRKDIDVICANSYSKSTLRSVAEECCADFDFVTYYPSFESVTMSDRLMAWEEDQVHVTKMIVDANISRMISAYLDADDDEINDIEVIRQRAKNRLDDGDDDACIELAGKVLNELPQDQRAIEYLVMATARKKTQEAALARMEGFDVSIFNVENGALYSRLLIRCKRFEEAAAEGEKMLATGTTSIKPLIVLGDAHLGMGNYEKAVEVFQTLLEQKKRIGLPYFKLANVYHEKGDAELAKHYIAIALSINPGNVQFKKLHDKIENK